MMMMMMMMMKKLDISPLLDFLDPSQSFPETYKHTAC